MNAKSTREPATWRRALVRPPHLHERSKSTRYKYQPNQRARAESNLEVSKNLSTSEHWRCIRAEYMGNRNSLGTIVQEEEAQPPSKELEQIQHPGHFTRAYTSTLEGGSGTCPI